MIRPALFASCICLGLVTLGHAREPIITAILPNDASAVPAAFVYEPSTGKSRPMSEAAIVRAAAELPASVPVDWAATDEAQAESWTLEGFVRPSQAEMELAPRGIAIPMRLEFADSGAVVEIMIYRSTPPHSYPWWEAHFIPEDGRRVTLTRAMYKGLTHANSDVWRHAAVSWDAAERRLSYFLDYTQLASQVLTEEQAAQLSTPSQLWIGGHNKEHAFQGGCQQVRISPGKLEPHDFLRASSIELSDVDFRSEPGPLPPAMGYVDLKLRYGAIGDGQHDDTAALQRAFAELANRVPIEYNTLYIPPGEYLISDTVQWTRFLVVQGAGRDKTTIRLKDNCPGFDHPEKLKPAVANGWQPWGEWGRGAGNVIGNYLFDLTIDVGAGNPGAVGLDHHANNHGCIENVTIRAAPNSGAVGLSLLRPWNGPAIVKHVRIEGFDIGIAATHREYSMTFEFLELAGQRTVGIQNRGDILAIRKLKSHNSVPAIRSTGGTTMISLLDSELSGGSPEVCAIENSAGLFARNVTTLGYRAALQHDDQVIDGATITEFVDQKPTMLFPGEARSLSLKIEDTPDVPWGDPASWTNIESFAQMRGERGDWAPAIQAAIDSGTETIFFPPGSYAVDSTVSLRGQVRRLIGMRNRIAGSERLPAGQPALRFDRPLLSGESPVAVSIDRMEVGPLEHASPHTLVLRHTAPESYWNAEGSGKLFIEDSVSNDFDFRYPQQVWARQWNVESHDTGPCIRCNGTTLWALGFKTEYESEKLAARNGSRVEIFGAFIYPVNAIPDDRPIFTLQNSDAAISYGTSVYVANHRVQIREAQDTVTREFLSADGVFFGPRQRVSLFVSRGRDNKAEDAR
jgi:hypothetical protein